MGALGLIAALLGLGCLVCFIIVLVKLFQNEGALKGVLGLICGLYTFIWGWINATKLGIKNIMLIWTVLLILSLVFNIASGGFSYGYSYPPTTP